MAQTKPTAAGLHEPTAERIRQQPVNRRVIWGAGFLAFAAFAMWANHATKEADLAASRDGLLLYAGIPGHSIAAWFLIVALLGGTAGPVLLIPALIAKIPRKLPRRIIGWTSLVAAAAAVPYVGILSILAYTGVYGMGDSLRIVAPDGQSVIVTQDDFDGDSVDIYIPNDDFHYKWVRSAPEISGWPRVEDQDCHLDSADGVLRLTCGSKTVVI